MTKPRLAGVKDAERFVQKWAPLMGFGHYRFRVGELPRASNLTEVYADADKSPAWAMNLFLHEDEWFEVRVIPGVLPLPQMEAVVIHELAHGLLSFAQLSDHTEESVCNRISRLLLGDEQPGPNIHFSSQVWTSAETVSPSFAHAAADPLLLSVLPLLVDELPPRELEVVNGVFWERASLRVIAQRLGISVRQVRRIRDRALVRLGHLLQELDEALEVEMR